MAPRVCLAVPELDPQLLQQPPPPHSHLVTAASVLWLRTPALVTTKAGLNSFPSPALCFASDSFYKSQAEYLFTGSCKAGFNAC